ncbi:hypothetical protein E1B28_009836 [Marasmius oreades]|uniref:RING-type domain-containing protein n=1 Tax=Marasmius oreades TaxID=181124 RepID=A0A9P7RVV4_9AGAR|nr:uncharacterized protein E1B28_009836 [Marasmius oreades]KAG7090746.1 hypothetical protein E1B28_009836 [Marasmius oreades]
MVPERAEGFELASSANFRDLCKTRLEQQEELYDTEIDPLYTDTLELDGGQTCLIPDPKLLWTNPECLGLKGLTANDRYQIVCRSLESKKIDASQILYKKVRKDTREDSGWLDNWKAGCVICADPEKPLSGLLACRCRFKAYCLECLRSLEESHEAGNDLREGRISCPTCRDLVYIISSSWVMLTQEEKAARLKKRSVEKIEKRRLNKLNKQLKKHVFGSDKPEDYDQGAASSSTPIGVHVMIGADRASHIKVMSLFLALDSTSPTEKIVNIYRAQYPSCDATDEEILARWST